MLDHEPALVHDAGHFVAVVGFVVVQEANGLASMAQNSATEKA